MVNKNIIFIFVSIVVNLFLGVLVVPLLSWMTTPEDLGLINFNINLLLVFLVILTFGYDQVYIREYAENQGIVFFKFCVFRSTVFFLLMSPIVYFLFNEYLYVYFVGYTAVIVRYLSLVPRMQGNMKVFSILNILPKLYIFLVLLGFFVFNLNIDLNTYLNCIVGVNLLIIITGLYFLKFNNYDKEKKIKEWDSFKYGIYMTISILLYYVIVTSSYWVLNMQSKIMDMTYLGLIVSCGAILGILQSIFSIIYAPMVFRNKNGNKKLAFDIVGLSAIFLILIASIFSPLFKFILPSIYHDLINVMYMGFYIPVLYVFMEISSVNLNLYKKNKYILISNLVAVFFQGFLYFIFWSELNFIYCLHIAIFSIFLSILLKSYFLNKFSPLYKIKIFNIYIVVLFVLYLIFSFFDDVYYLYLLITILLLLFFNNKLREVLFISKRILKNDI